MRATEGWGHREEEKGTARHQDLRTLKGLSGGVVNKGKDGLWKRSNLIGCPGCTSGWGKDGLKNRL